MKIQNQIILDKYIGLPLGIGLNIVVRILGKILRINHKLDREFERIAVVKFKGMGSIIQSTPFLRALRKLYPEAKIVFISSAQNESLLKEITEIDEYILLNDKGFSNLILSAPAFILKLISSKFQLLFDLEVYSNLSSIISTLSCATNRFGYYLSGSQYRMGLYTHMMFYNSTIHLSQNYLQLARHFNLNEFDSSLSEFPAEDLNELALLIDQTRPFICINVNASDLRTERRWGSEKFAKVIDRIRKELSDYQIVMIGSKSEKAYVEGVISKVKEDPDSIIDLSGQTNIKQLISVLSKASLLLSCDTGPAHLAFAQKIPSVLLFGPVNPRQFDIPKNSTVVYKNLYCSPCVHDFDTPPCMGDNQCMKQITVDEVFDNVKGKLLNQNPPSSETNTRVFRKDNGDALGTVGR